MFSQAQVADGSRSGALAAGLVTLAFLTLFPCAGYAQSDVREFALGFETPEGEALTVARVLAGGTTEVAVVLTNVEVLEPDEAVSVTLTAETVSVVPPVVTLAETTPRITLSIEAAVDAVFGETVEATGVVLSGGSAVENTSVSSATLVMGVVARRFRLSVSGLSRAAFVGEETPAVSIPDNRDEQSVRSTITTISVEEDITIELLAVTVSISHTYIGDLQVRLISPEGTEVVLHDQTGIDTDDIRQVYTSAGNAGLASLTGESARGDWILTVGDYSSADVGRLESWGLYVNPSPGGDLRVVAGSALVAVVELTGVVTPFGESRLAPGERLTASFEYDGTGVDVAPVTLVASSSSPVAGLVAAAGLTASADASSGVLRAEGGGLANAVVEAVPSSVTVLDRQFHLSLLDLSGAAFVGEEAPAVGIPDNGLEQSVRSTISVVEDITVELLAVAVSISHTHINDLRVTLISPEGTEVVLHDRTGASADDIRQVYASAGNAGLASLTGESARGDWVLTVGDYGADDTGRLESWGLYVNPSSTVARVVAGGSASVLVELAGVETPFGRVRLLPGETVPVTLAVEGVNVSTNTVVLSMTAPRATLTIDATGVAAGTAGSVTATGVVLSDGSAVENTSVSPATLAIEVVPAPVELQLAFEPTTLAVRRGATTTAELSLLGDVPAGAKVLVELSVADATTARVGTAAGTGPVEFDAVTLSREVTVRGVAAGSVTVTAMAV